MAITVADKKLWEKAIEKCKTEKPRVKALAEFGKYEVCGHGGCYVVTWSGKGQEMKAECSCPAGKKGKPCYHVPATSGAFKLAVQTRASARVACAEPTCDGIAVEGGKYCQNCINDAEECLFG